MNIGPNQRKDREGTGFSENILCVSIMVIRAQHHQPKIFGTAEYLILITIFVAYQIKYELFRSAPIRVRY